MYDSYLLDLLEHATSPWHSQEKILNSLLKCPNASFTNYSLHNEDFFNPKKNLMPQGVLASSEKDALIAWSLPKTSKSHVKIWASHLDSPTLKLKPKGVLKECGSYLFALEPYGSPILSTWMNQSLFLSGRVMIRHKEQVLIHTLELKQCPFVIEPLAIHLNRGEPSKNLEKINPQNELRALVCPMDLSTSGINGQCPHYCPLIATIATELKLEPHSFQLLAHDLFASPYHPTTKLYNDEYLLSARIDNLVSASAMAEELMLRAPQQEDSIIAIWTNHEEIGSNSGTGAQSGFFQSVVNQLLSHFHLTNPVIYSIDGAHGQHPNYSKQSEPEHAPILGQGPVIKHNTNGRYRRDFEALKRLCLEQKGTYQEFSMRSDMPCGSTVGPILSASLGISCLDMGIAQLGMHAMRELCSIRDYETLKKLI